MADDLEHKKELLKNWLETVEDEKILNELLMVKEDVATYSTSLSEPLTPLPKDELASIKKGLNSPYPTISREEAKKVYAKYL